MSQRILIVLLLCTPRCFAADTVAVLPFFNGNEGVAANLNWIGESAAETIQELLDSAGLMVLSRDDREEVYRRLSVRASTLLTKATVMRIGESLDAGYVVYGDYQVIPDSAGVRTLKSALTMRVHVIDLRHLHENPAIEQTSTLEQLSQTEMRLAWMLRQQLVPGESVSEEEFLRTRPAVRVEAMESYVRGLMATGYDQRIRLFTQATRLDEHFSPPAFQLGRMYFQRKEYRTAAGWLGKVTKADSHYNEAQFRLGICRYYENDFDGAIPLFRSVLTEVPLNEVYNDLGAALSRKNDPAAAENFRKALEGDEADPDYWFNLGFALWRQGDFTHAAAQFRAVLERSAGDQDATYFLGRALRGEGPRAGEPRSEGRERIKTTFEDSAFRQLQAELKGRAK